MTRIRSTLIRVFIVVSCLSSVSVAGNIEIVCPCRYSIEGDIATLEIDRIVNNGTDATDTLYVSLWFTETSDPYTNGYTVAQESLATNEHDGSIEPDHEISDISLITTFNSPPNGEYFIHLFVSEESDLDVALDLVTFTETLRFGLSIHMVGEVSYEVSGETVILEVEQIENSSDTHSSGSLYLSFWFTNEPDPYTNGFLTARATLATEVDAGTLAPGESYQNVSLTTDFTWPQPGEYYVHVYVSQYPDLNEVLDLLTFTETISVGDSHTDDHGDEPTSATAIDVNSSTHGTIGNSGDVDVFRIDLDEAGVLIAETQGEIDTYGRLLNEKGEIVRVDDDSGENRNSRIESNLTQGTWYVEISGYDRSVRGDYVLHVKYEPELQRLITSRLYPHLGDFNGDGYDDVLLRHIDGRWYYYPMRGREYLIDERGFANLTRNLHYSVAGIGDFNGDGKDDLLLRHQEGLWLYYPMDGRQYIEGEAGIADLTIDPNYQIAGVGDFDGDSRDDVLLRHSGKGDWIYFPMNGRHPIPDGIGPVELTQDLDYRVAGVGDFNGDGRDDVLLRHIDGHWFYYPMSGPAYLSGQQGTLNLIEDLDYELAGIGDLNGDGNDDVLLRHSDGHWYYYPMEGAKFVAGQQGEIDISSDVNFRLAGIGDINGDGYEDILLRHNEGSWYYYPMNGREAIESEEGSLDLTTHLDWHIPIYQRDLSISGAVIVAEGQVLDGDTGDPEDPKVPNDTVENPQSVPIPASIAGYLIEDLDDWDLYRIEIPNANVTARVSLVIADSENADLDLHLAETSGTIIEESRGIENTEIVETSLTGEFLVAVSAFSGESNYSLVISIRGRSSENQFQSTTWSRDGDFVSDELIAIPRETQNTALDDLANERPQLTQSLNISWDGQLMRFSHFDSQPLRSKFKLDIAGLQYDDDAVRHRAALLTLRKIMAKNESFSHVQPNYVYRQNAEPNDLRFTDQWHYPKISLPSAWDLTTGDPDSVVAVIDTGVVTHHPDMAPRLFRDDDDQIVGYDFIRDPTRANDGDGMDPDPFDSGDMVLPGGVNSYHGTHVAGTIGAATNDGRSVAGVTWHGEIMPIRVLGVGGGTTQDIADGIRYAAGLDNASGTVPIKRADVMNLSLGASNEFCMPTPDVDFITKRALEDAMTAGVVVVVSAGNDNCHYPAAMTQVANVISVGATDLYSQRAPYSNYGSSIDVVAPGGDTSFDRDGDGYPDGVLSSWYREDSTNNQYGASFFQGTSMAAPHVTGVVMLMLAINPNLTIEDINRLLNGTHADPSAHPITWDLGIRGRDEIFGHGLIDAFRAVNAARTIAGGRNEISDRPILDVSPDQLYFGAIESTLHILLRNEGTGTLNIESVETSAAWLSASYDEWPKLVIRVNRSGLAEGAHVGYVTINSDGGNVSISVTIRVQDEVSIADVGTVYALTMDPMSNETLSWATTSARGQYSFTLPAAPDGRYLVAAGTDRDGDGFICDAGEACGIWPLLDSPGVIEVDRNKSIEFVVSVDLFARISSQSVNLDDVPENGFAIDRSVEGENYDETNSFP